MVHELGLAVAAKALPAQAVMQARATSLSFMVILIGEQI
jgi:hypothetical protein